MSLESEVRRIAHDEGYSGITDFLCAYRSFGYRVSDIKIHMAYIYNLHYSSSHFFNTLNPYLSKAKRKFQEKKYREKLKAERHGFKDVKTMRRWFRVARNLGWPTPKRCIQGLLMQGLTNDQIGKYFNVTGSSIKKRRTGWNL